ncbi:MAG TPA: hypothetical protein VN154_09405 [Rhizomicrobium sp.]|nr:hypothetical protein [Rhizomicrobium sp.]
MMFVGVLDASDRPGIAYSREDAVAIAVEACVGIALINDDAEALEDASSLPLALQ